MHPACVSERATVTVTDLTGSGSSTGRTERENEGDLESSLG